MSAQRAQTAREGQQISEQEERRLKRKLEALQLAADDRLFAELGRRASAPYPVDAHAMNESTSQAVGRFMKEAEALVRAAPGHVAFAPASMQRSLNV